MIKLNLQKEELEYWKDVYRPYCVKDCWYFHSFGDYWINGTLYTLSYENGILSIQYTSPGVCYMGRNGCIDNKDYNMTEEKENELIKKDWNIDWNKIIWN